MSKVRPDESHAYAMGFYKDAFEQFIRNGVWGTCCDCPRSNDGREFPELCNNHRRSDHTLSFAELIEAYNGQVAFYQRRQGRLGNK